MTVVDWGVRVMTSRSPLLQLVALLTIMGFFPASVGAWNFVDIDEAKTQTATVPNEGTAITPPTSTGPVHLATSRTDEAPRAVPGLRALSGSDLQARRVKPRRRQVAAANLPSPAELLAGVKAAMGGAQETLGQLAPDGPLEAATALAEADTLRNAGLNTEAVLAYIALMDAYPGTQEAAHANEGLESIAIAAGDGTLTQSEAYAIDGALPAWESLSAAGRYVLHDWYWMRALAAYEAGNTSAIEACYAQSRELAIQFLREHPDQALAMPVALELYETQDWAASHGLTTRTDAVSELERIAASNTPGLARMGANWALANHYSKVKHARGAIILHNANILNELEYDYIDQILGDPYVQYWIKSLIGHAVGTALVSHGWLEEALQWYENPAFHIRKTGGTTTEYINFDIAKIKQQLEPQNPAVAIAAFEEFINAYPDSELVPMACLEFGNIFMTAGDYRGAADLYRQVMQTYPDTTAAALAENELSFIMAYLYDSVQYATSEQVVGAEPQPTQLAQLCGPEALHHLLVSEGIESTVDELAGLAGTDEMGTTMAGLIKAALTKGVRLVGVEAPGVDRVPTPFIAFVNNNHFLVVEEVNGNDVTVLDGDATALPMGMATFGRMWDGKALVLGNAPQVAKLLDMDALERTRGGRGSDEITFDPVPTPDCSGDCCKCPPGGAGLGSCDPSNSNGDGGRPKGNPPPGAMQSPAANTGVNSPGVHPSIYPMSTLLTLEETDLGVSVRGPMTLLLKRWYTCQKGFHDDEYTETSKPWSNNIGDGWTHTLNMHVRTSTPGGSGYPTTVTFYDETGVARAYTYDSTWLWFNLYYRTSNGTNKERGNLLFRNASTGKFTLRVPGELEYQFSTPTTDENRYARIEALEDASGNQITFSYDGVVGTGKLTKVDAPSGDTRALHFGYSSNFITKVELKKGTTSLQSVSYEYDDDDNLTKVIDGASAYINYAYASYGSATGSRYITKVTDKAGIDTDFGWSFDENADELWEAYKIDLDNADGLTTTYDRSLSTNVCTVTNTSGQSSLSKFVYTPVSGAPSRIQSMDYYYGDLTSYQRWSYEWSGQALTKVKAAGETVLDTSFNASGRVTSRSGSPTPGEHGHHCPQVIGGSSQGGGGGSGSGASPGSCTVVRTLNLEYESSTGLYPARVQGPDGLWTYYYYDSNNQLISVTHPSVHEDGWRFAYDSYGQLTSTTDPTGNSATYAYDNMGNVTSVTDPNSNSVSLYYDDFGRVTQYVDANSNSKYYYYSTYSCGGTVGCSSGQLTKVKDALNNETEFQYSVRGDLTKIILAVGDDLESATDIAYDNMRLTKITSPSGSSNTMTFTYDIQGYVVTKEDFEGNKTYYDYDHMGRVTTITDPVDSVSLGYNTLGNLISVTDGLNHTTTFDYDSDKQLTKVTDAAGKVVKYFYDSAGRATKVGAGSSGTTDPTEYFYSGTTGLLTKVRYNVGATDYDANYYYDGNARLTKLVDWIDENSSLRYTYDPGGRLISMMDYDHTDVHDSVLTYAYDGMGLVTSMNDYNGNSTTYTYTTTNQVSTITAPGGKTWYYDYNTLGQPTSLTIPNGMTTAYTYDNRNRLTKIEHKDVTTVKDSFTYALDDNGTVTKVTQQDDAYWEYEYDGRLRLTKGERYNPSDTLLKRYTYTYDDGDSMTTKEVYTPSSGTVTTTFSHNSANEMNTMTTGGTTTNFTYDNWGRTISKYITGSYSAAYTYGPVHMLSTVTSDFPSEESVTYAIGSDGKRRSRTTSSEETWYNWAGFMVISEEDDDAGAGNLTRTYIGHTLAHADGTSFDDSNYAYYFHDLLGSTRRLRDHDKNSDGQYEYTPYGEIYAESGTVITRKYALLEWDPATQLHYALLRYHSSATTRWTTRDPLGMMDGPNMYAYCVLRPTFFNDPTGLRVCGSKLEISGNFIWGPYAFAGWAVDTRTGNFAWLGGVGGQANTTPGAAVMAQVFTTLEEDAALADVGGVFVDTSVTVGEVVGGGLEVGIGNDATVLSAKSGLVGGLLPAGFDAGVSHTWQSSPFRIPFVSTGIALGQYVKDLYDYGKSLFGH
jgi:RHS repeat-associated protein